MKNTVMLHWERSHVKAWLNLVELEEYQGKFATEQVDGRILLAETIKGSQYGMKDTHAKKFMELRAAFK